MVYVARMAREIITILKDDIDGSEATETIEFAFSGVGYSIDLSKANADKFRKDMSKYIENSTRTGGRAARGTGAARSKNSDTAKIKAWADEQGMEYPQRGRLPGSLIEAYEAANKS